MSAATGMAMEIKQHERTRKPDWSKSEIETRGDSNRVTVHFNDGTILYCYGNFSQKRCV
jgi:hypothetical protein